MMFGYFFACIFYTNFITPNYYQSDLNFFRFFGKLSFSIQIIYIMFVVLTSGFVFYEPDSYYYYSPICILGILFFGIDKIIAGKNTLFWIVCVSLILTTVGHSSSFLAFYLIICLVYQAKVSMSIKIFIAIAGVLSIFGIVLYVPSFTDANALWRVFYWMYTLKTILINNFSILGNGFGIPYADENIAYFLEVTQEYTTRLSDEDESYLSPMHNSFITFAFHIGLIWALVLLSPVIKYFTNLIIKRNYKFCDYDLIALSVMSFFIWSSFNVILELPHSAILVWYSYFLFKKMKSVNKG